MTFVYLICFIIAVSMKSNAVNTYLIDEFGEIKEWSFMGFAKERYGLIIGKHIIPFFLY